jgi:hypothetical protein
LLLSALIVAAAVLAAAFLIGARVSAAAASDHEAARRVRRLQLMALFAPGIAAASDDPRAILAWQPLAAAARALFPDDFAELDRAAGAAFPFSDAQIQAAHARWSAEWLAWECAHDAEYKLKAAGVEEQLKASGGSAVLRAQLENVEREKLERYQRRYEEYTRVSRALKEFMVRQAGRDPAS